MGNLLLLDHKGLPLLDPDDLHHPWSVEWFPSECVGPYLEHWVRRPMSQEAQSKLRAECPHPMAPQKVCETPVVDPKIAQFLTKSVRLESKKRPQIGPTLVSR